MRRRLLAALGGLLLLLGGCGAQARTGAETPDKVLTVYRLTEDRSGRDLAEPETYVLPEDEPVGVEKAVELFAGPSGSDGLVSALPAGVTVEDWSLDRGAVTLVLSDGFLERPPLDRTAAALCAALTLCPLEDVETVTLEAGGQTLFSGLTPADFLLEDAPGGPEEADAVPALSGIGEN